MAALRHPNIVQFLGKQVHRVLWRHLPQTWLHIALLRCAALRCGLCAACAACQTSQPLLHLGHVAVLCC